MRGTKRAKETGKAYMKWVRGSADSRKTMRAQAKEAGAPLNKSISDFGTAVKAGRKKNFAGHVAGAKGTAKAYMKWVKKGAAGRKKLRATKRKHHANIGRETNTFLKKNTEIGKEHRARTRKLRKNFIATARGKKVEEAMDLVKRSKANRAATKEMVVAKIKANQAEYKGRKKRFKKQLMSPKALRAQSKKNIQATRQAHKDWRASKKAARKARRRVYRVGLQHNEDQREDLIFSVMEALLDA